jgi:hypothetical protein
MKRFGNILLYVGVSLVLAAGSWLKLIVAWWSTGATLCLIAVDAVIAGTGAFLSQRSSRGH